MIEISAESLFQALDNYIPEVAYYLDLHSGAVLMRNLEMGADDDVAGMVDAEPSRYLAIPPVSNRDALGIRETFAEDVAPPYARPALRRALDGRSPFHRFKDSVHTWPDIVDAWRLHECQSYRAVAEAWLQAEGIDYSLPSTEVEAAAAHL